MTGLGLQDKENHKRRDHVSHVISEKRIWMGLLLWLEPRRKDVRRKNNIKTLLDGKTSSRWPNASPTLFIATVTRFGVRLKQTNQQHNRASRRRSTIQYLVWFLSWIELIKRKRKKVCLRACFITRNMFLRSRELLHCFSSCLCTFVYIYVCVHAW